MITNTTEPNMSLEDVRERQRLESKMQAALTPAELASWRALSAGDAPGWRGFRHPSTLLDYSARVARRPAGAPLALDGVALVPFRHVPSPMGGVEIDGVPTRLGDPFSWMSLAALDAFAAGYEAMLAPVWKSEVDGMIAREVPRTTPDRDAVIAAAAAKREPRWRAERVYWGRPLEGDDRWNVRAIADAAGHALPWGNPYRESEVRSFLQDFDPWHLYRCFRVEGAASSSPTTWIQSGGAPGFPGDFRERVSDPLAALLLEVARQKINNAGGVVAELEEWWRGADPAWARVAIPSPPSAMPTIGGAP